MPIKLPGAIPWPWSPRGDPRATAGGVGPQAIRINLLPPSLRPALNPLQGLLPGPWLKPAIVACVAVYLLLVVTAGIVQHRLNQLNAAAAQLSPQRLLLNTLQGRMAELNGRIQQLVVAESQRRRWADKLHHLSDVLPEHVWFSQVLLDSAVALQIDGTVVAPMGEEVPTINRLVNALKAHPAFSAPFQEIVVESVRRRQIQNIEVADFTVLCIVTK